MIYNDNTLLTEGKFKFTSIQNTPANYLLKQVKITKDVLLRDYINKNYDALVIRNFHESSSRKIVIDYHCNKNSYYSEKEAFKDLRRISKKNQENRKPVRIYLCDCGAYHLTSKPFNLYLNT